MPQYAVIGKPIARPDGVDKVTGRARYAADYFLPGTLWGKTLHSPYPHARILRIDTSAARRLPGVHAVITAADIDSGPWGRAIKDMPVLARDRVRFAGERVAAVAADDEDVAQQALDLIEVEYEELPAVFDPLEAMSESAPLLHPDFGAYPGGRPLERPTNVYSSAVNERGDLERGFAEADVIVEGEYTTPRQHHAYLEPQTVLVQVEGETVRVWACSKAPYDTRNAMAVAIELPAERIVFNHTYIGGDFGGKATPANLPVCYFLARATGRPVIMVHDYVEEFMAANPRHSTVIRLRTGVKRDGTITAHHVQAYVNTGAYAGYKPLGIIGGGVRAATGGPYRIPNLRLESHEIYTNTVPCGHMRSPGEPQGAFALESHIDEVARAIGMDPLEFRLRNVVVDGDEMPLGHVHHDLKGRETLLAAAEAAGYARPSREGPVAARVAPAAEGAVLIGRGIAICDRAPGGGVGTAEVTLQPDGTVIVGTAVFDQGTGTYATQEAIVAEALQVPPERIRFQYWATGNLEFDSGIGGMRATRVNTMVAFEAAQDAKRQLLALAAERLAWPEDKIVLRGDEIRRLDQEEAVRWPDLLFEAGRSVTGRAHVEERGRSEVTCFAAQIAEVSVDPETGEVKLLSLTTAHDTGQVVNPIGHQGQINGGLMQGIGYGLMEELEVEDGRVTTLSFGDYKVPTARDIPALKTVLLESDSGVGPFQVKGIGETPNIPTAAAIANAVADACGVRIRDLPITAEKVYRALRAAKG
ncbi:MAG TPA: xanthine dehydrogenase family protein molybdopterin-binding subunit [Dehalococcoidia bacterium]|nr:xanthine dehydrogenase family protein molybdopterin-binding subunit [Dehalococcoidia bacterium]